MNTVTRRPPLTVAMLPALWACKAEPTQLMVVVDSDLAVPADIVRVRAAVLESTAAFSSESVDERNLDLASTPFPFSFGIAPRGDLTEPVVLVVEGLAASGPPAKVAVRKLARFREGETLLLPVILTSSCYGVVCPQRAESCEQGVCGLPTADPSLRAIEPGEELVGWPRPTPTLRPDAGAVTDSGAHADAQIFPDATSPDANRPPDGGPRPDGAPPPDGGPPADAASPPPDGGASGPPETTCTVESDCDLSSSCRYEGDNGLCKCDPMRGNHCVAECTGDNDCGYSAYCRPPGDNGACRCALMQNFCVPGCGTASDCPTGGPVFRCVNGLCAP
ncbi:MAG: hypothetical protein HYV07_03890 [Deltaproteobacteria bacterium]|nr:hypothetical protein [Deltaproteobacteria bacterium]